MASVKAASMTIGIPGVEIVIWYNDANNRIGNVEWTITPPGVVARLRVWDSNISDVTPVIDRTEGQGSGAETVPGNYQMVEVTEPGVGTYMTLPSNLTYAFTIRTI